MIRGQIRQGILEERDEIRVHEGLIRVIFRAQRVNERRATFFDGPSQGHINGEGTFGVRVRELRLLPSRSTGHRAWNESVNGRKWKGEVKSNHAVSVFASEVIEASDFERFDYFLSLS